MTYTPDTPLEALAGIGPKKAQAFQKLGVATLRDLACLYPRRYEDRTQFRTIADAPVSYTHLTLPTTMLV